METHLTPDSFRLFGHFAPALWRERRELRLRLNLKSFLAAARTPRRWAADEPTPFEAMRVLDPAPNPRNLAQGNAALIRAFPGFAKMQVVDSWGGMVDVTPDGVPVIGPVPGTPGFYLASGFSGHGFGIGPGAGRLMADLVLGLPPLVDPTPFRFARLNPSLTRATPARA